MALQDTLVAEPPPLQVDKDGVVRVGGTRVTLDTVVGAYLDGADAEEIVAAYDSLSLPDVHAAISYYLRHCAEVEAYLNERRQQAEEVRKENERRFPANGLRERMLSHRRASAILADIASLPMEPGGTEFSSRDHDKILYDGKDTK